MEHSVFISYRRADTSGHAGRISDDLERQFRYPVVFQDIDSINAGDDFTVSLQQALSNARVCLVLIGDTWLTEKLPDGTRRLDAPVDHVRHEIEMALANEHMLVLPVLVEGAQMPTEQQLPKSLQKLARLQAVELSERRWDYDLNQLVDVLRKAGIESAKFQRKSFWLLGAALALILATVGLFFRPSSNLAESYTGLWYLPSGSFWTVREKDKSLWVEETHYDSRQVWKSGTASLENNELTVSLSLVFEQQPYQYLHRLHLSSDKQSMLGTIKRSDQSSEASVILTRDKP